MSLTIFLLNDLRRNQIRPRMATPATSNKWSDMSRGRARVANASDHQGLRPSQWSFMSVLKATSSSEVVRGMLTFEGLAEVTSFMSK